MNENVMIVDSEPMDALEEAKGSEYDIFLIDLKFPRTNGISLLKKIREHQESARYIMITAYGSLVSAIEAFKAGVSDFILKPFELSNLIESIKRQLVIKNRIDSYSVKWGESIDSKGVMEFDKFFHVLDIRSLEKLNNCEAKLKDLSNEYDLIAKNNIFLLKKMAVKVKKEKKLATEMLSYVGHEIRSPLSSIIGYTRTLMKQHELGRTEYLSEFLNNILTSSLYMLDLTHNILSSSVLEENKLTLDLEPVSITDMLKKVKSSLLTKIESKNLKFKEKIQSDLPFIIADRLKLAQILYNLLNNAIEHTGKGEVKIKARIADDRKSVLFSIKDTGAGISDEDKSKLFQKFGKIGNKDKKGVGLGLSIAKSLVELHGGKIWLKSKLGRGSTFFFTIPLKKMS
jgi:signal transduction histidine kinase